jgi:protein-tyrosine phosphatase
MFPGGRLYRSGTFDFLTPAEAAGLASSLGFVTVIDLRRPSERVRSHQWFPGKVEVLQIPFLAEIDPAWEHPIDQSPVAVAGRYLDMLARQGREALRSIIIAITPDSLPMVIHCSAGKDRSGIVTALLLALAGVTDEAIAGATSGRGRSSSSWPATRPPLASLRRTRRTNTKRRLKRCGCSSTE